jgi:hypothetical protein
VGLRAPSLPATKSMNLNKEQFTQFIEDYISYMIGDMDAGTLEAMVFDLLFREYQSYTVEKILCEIKELYS